MIRHLRAGEEPRLLELLANWPFRHGESALEVFGPYLEHDPSYTPRNVLVAEEAGTLMACVQIFPRRLRTGGAARDSVSIPAGGIGTVFTHASRRSSGLATRLLEVAIDEMSDRGFEVSALVAAKVGFYEQLGWVAWCRGHRRLACAPATLPSWSHFDLRPLDLEFDSAAVRRIGDSYSNRFPGTVVRDAADWATGLEHGVAAGERMTVAVDDRRIVAYLRAAELYGSLHLLEWGYDDLPSDSGETRTAERANGPCEAAAELIVLATQGAIQPARVPAGIEDERLELAVERLGGEWLGGTSGEEGSSTWMLRVLDEASLRARLLDSTVTLGSSMDDRDVMGALHIELLEAAFPRAQFGFWTADRF